MEGTDTLTLTVTNDTVVPNEYTMNEVYINFGGGITGVSSTSLPTGWSYVADAMVDGMGIFNICFTNGVGNDPDAIQPGETIEFEVTFTGSGDEKDFTGAFNEKGFLAAGKWIGGPGDDSAFGGLVPAPGALALLAVAGALSGRRRRRR